MLTTFLQQWPDDDNVPEARYMLATSLRTQGAAHTAATTKLQKDLRVLDNQRTYLDRIMTAAIAATGATDRPPPLPG